MRSSILSSEKPAEEVGIKDLIEEVREESVCRQLLRLKPLSPLVFYTVLFLLLGQLAAAVMPWVLPDGIYLYLYLGSEARESTRKFLNDQHPFLIYDPLLGWRNRPNMKHNKWVIDENGARTTHRVGFASKKRYLLFLGNSLINGGTNISNDETVSAYIEDASTESINFATMLYTLDQVYLDYKERLGRYKADVVVVGLPGRSTPGLLNQYIPFRVKVETKMPFFKPRFEVRSGELSLVPVLPRSAYENLFSSPEIVKTLARTDAYYSEFNRYKWFGLMPGSTFLYSSYEKIKELVRLTGGDLEGRPLLKKLIEQMVRKSRERNAETVFVTLPDLRTVAPGVWRQYLPDLYGEMVNDLKREGYNVVDVRPPLRESGLSPEKLFDADGVHYSSVGNRIIAAALKDAIAHLKQAA